MLCQLMRISSSNIIFEQFYEANGRWRKIIKRREAFDPALYTPKNARLRSSKDVLDFLIKKSRILELLRGKTIFEQLSRTQLFTVFESPALFFPAT